MKRTLLFSLSLMLCSAVAGAQETRELVGYSLFSFARPSPNSKAYTVRTCLTDRRTKNRVAGMNVDIYEGDQAVLQGTPSEIKKTDDSGCIEWSPNMPAAQGGVVAEVQVGLKMEGTERVKTVRYMINTRADNEMLLGTDERVLEFMWRLKTERDKSKQFFPQVHDK